MRKGIGYTVVALAVAAALFGLSFALFAGGREADALRVAGFELLLLAARLVSQARSSFGPGGSATRESMRRARGVTRTATARAVYYR